jgi:hypothetical protein
MENCVNEIASTELIILRMNEWIENGSCRNIDAYVSVGIVALALKIINKDYK